MFKIKLKASVLQKILEYTKKPYEQIGLLIGKLSEGGLIVTDAIHGEGFSTDSCTVFPPETLAKVMDDILKGKINGNIVGWYHSHIGCGVFMSNIDIQTQLKLQQFSPYIIALVVDPIAGEFGVFSYDYHYGLIQFSEDQIEIF
ncbi:MAG: hypothetical protein QW476_00520 [Candidatus Bathyarchaeia archaeon]|nr:Mov34/MPN/PAD-1 family protein [Candidatus Bathyarchaeota archaeon]